MASWEGSVHFPTNIDHSLPFRLDLNLANFVGLGIAFHYSYNTIEWLISLPVEGIPAVGCQGNQLTQATICLKSSWIKFVIPVAQDIRLPNSTQHTAQCRIQHRLLGASMKLETICSFATGRWSKIFSPVMLSSGKLYPIFSVESEISVDSVFTLYFCFISPFILSFSPACRGCLVAGRRD